MRFDSPTPRPSAKGRPRQQPSRPAAWLLTAVLVAMLAFPAVALAESQMHVSFARDADRCAVCHSAHNASPNTRGLLGPPTLASQMELCYVCHGEGAPGAERNLEYGPDSFGQPSGHRLEGSTSGGDLTNTCTACHSPHDDSELKPKLPQPSINGTSTTLGDVNSVCFTCHDDARSWEPTGYPAVTEPERDVAGYPVKGTFPGKSTYVDPDANPHSRIPTTSPDQVRGDCRNCHNTHGGPNAYDSLKYTYRPSSVASTIDDRVNGTYAEACFVCHGGQAEWLERGAADIKSFVTSNAVDPDFFGGHRIKTVGATQPLYSPLLCYECHGAHGSSRGNASMLTDERGANLRTDTPETLRRFCFTCHSSDDGKVWDSQVETYTAVSTTDTVLGLRRDGTLLAGQVPSESSWTTNWLRLSSRSEAHSSGDTESCYACHGGGDYGSATGNNVHNPSRGSIGTILDEARTRSCYECHASYEQYMEDGVGAKTGALRSQVYHHVLGGPLGDGDASITEGYLNSTTEIRCTSCHQGHSTETSQAIMLRAGIDRPATETASSDYLASGSGGLCASCHATTLPKDTENQLSDGTTSTPWIRAGSGPGGYGVSAHSFAASTTLGDGSVFASDCSKCHSDGLTAGGAGAPAGEGTHWFRNSRLLATLGGVAKDPLQETPCYRCHSRATDSVGGAVKRVAGRDWYGVATMTVASESVFRQFSGASSHPVSATVNATVDCTNCHNVHSVSATSAVSDPANTYNSYPYRTDADRDAFCMRCHGGTALPRSQVSTSTFVPRSVSVAATRTALMNKATFAAKGHSVPNGSISASETVACAVCHDEHGSVAPKLLGAYDAATGTNRIGSTSITANNNEVCYACHTGDTTATQSYDASGYPTDGRWPGRAVYDGTYGIHSRATVVRPGTDYAGGDCKNCHDAHGTGSLYDKLTGTGYSRTYFGSCFDCHNATHRKGLNVWQYYPASAGGSSTDSRAGHATVTNGFLPAGSVMPCYDCHNNHGSANPDALEVHTVVLPGTSLIVGDQVGEIAMYAANGSRDAAGVRRFCLTCHTTSDTSKGWNGTSMAIVVAGCYVEGIDRISPSARLRLTATQAAHSEASTQDCEGSGCHGYTYGGTKPANLHDPRVN